MKFCPKYFAVTILLFVIEVIIAIFVHDDFIRPYFGDFLVVILIYCFVKSFFNLPILKTALLVLLFSFAVEFLQYLNFIAIIGLENSKLAKIVIGNSFSWNDIFCYTLGVLCVILIETSLKISVK